MKLKKLTLLTLISMFLFASCEIPYDEQNDDATILGTWNVEAIHTVVDATGLVIDTQSTIEMSISEVRDAFDIDKTFVFTENPNECVSEGSYSDHVFATLHVVDSSFGIDSAEDYNFDEPLDYTTETTSWLKSGNQLTFTSSTGESVIMEITELTDHSLKMNGDVQYVLDTSGFGGSPTGGSITLTAHIDYTCVR